MRPTRIRDVVMRKLFNFLALSLVTLFALNVQAQEIYAVRSSDGNTVTLYYDNQRTSLGGVTDWSIYNKNPNAKDGVDRTQNHVTKIVFDSSMKNARPTSMNNWFQWFTGVTQYEHLDYLNTSQVTSMGGLFYCNYSVTALDVSGFDTKNVTDMESMFRWCYKLANLDVSGFDTHNVKYMSNMFQSCALTSIDISNFDISNLTHTNQMFASCSDLTSIFCDKNWSKSATITSSTDMFRNCKKLSGSRGTRYNDNNAHDITYAHPDGGSQNPGYFRIAGSGNSYSKTLKGIFSVSAGKTVYFSQGNLQYSAYNNLWFFANEQYEIVGENNQYISATSGYCIDLFGFGTSGYQGINPWTTSYNDEDYAAGDLYGTDYDWGHYNPIVNGGNEAGLWYTMTMEEWDYLLHSRPKANALQGIATVNNIKAYILLPDAWQQPSSLNFTPLATSFSTNTYSADQWKTMEDAGAVCLPIGGWRDGKSVEDLDRYGHYWTSTADPDDVVQAGEVYFGIDPGYTTMLIDWIPSKASGLSVRLVRTASDKQDIDQINHKSEIINHKFIKNGQLLIERNGKTYNAQGAEVK